ADMVPDLGCTSLGLEYFCTEGDDLWRMSDHDLVELGKREVERIGLARAADVEDGCVVRVAKAYPVYDSSYVEQLAMVRGWIASLANLQTIGRNGLHRYNNQDHAMLTGMLAVRNLLHGEAHDLWSVNTDREYQEEIRAPELEAALARAFAKLDRVAFGAAIGTVSGVGLALATAILVVRGGSAVGPHLVLLAQYFPGYRVTPAGIVIGLAWGVVGGFSAGWMFALVRNTAAFLYERLVRRRAEAVVLRDILDHV
ncbi:MAG TPA: hypothetical protein VEM57_08215, partial [Candidatus Binatus sp.]|nr:hypothetical protein [Candidatus Binatus sp.]